MIFDYDDDFEIWWFDYMGILYDKFMLWDLVINGKLVHDHLMVDGLYDNDNLWVILLNLYLRWCLC